MTIAALPTFATPFDWRLVAQLSDEYQISDVNVLAGAIRAVRPNPGPAARVATRVPNHWTPAVFTAARTEVGRLFLGFARFPAVRAFVGSDDATTVRWNEMRFAGGRGGSPRRAGREDFFSATVRMDREGRAIEQRQGR